MKDIIKVTVSAKQVDFGRDSADALAVGIFSDVSGMDKLVRMLDKAAGGAMARVLTAGDFKGDTGSCEVVYTGAKSGPKRILLVGLGKKKEVDADVLRKAASVVARRAVAAKVGKLTLALQKAATRVKPEVAGRAMAEGAYFGAYRYDEFVTGRENGRLRKLAVYVGDDSADAVTALRKGISVGVAVGEAQSYGRTIANRPGNVINPPTLAAEARKMAAAHKSLKCTILDKKQLTAKKMGGILAVGSASASDPRFIILKHTPNGRVRKGAPKVAIVGKAITFDAGGISIKPSADMDQMKLDKSGGVAVLATMKAISELNVPLNIYGLIPSAENVLGGSGYRPGDIVTTYSGKTVEILNTDAEGRMILSDGIAYAAEQKCDIIVDIATLTGACMVALGSHKAGLMSNDDGLLDDLKKAAEESGEKVWHLPSGDEYADEMKSKIADLKNIGGRWGGASTAAAFLRQFAGDARWAHLDIAGMDLFAKATSFAAEGSTAFGVRLLTTFLMNVAAGK